MKKCPCHSGKSYQTCCEPYHLGKLPPTVEALMRSRYSAFSLGLTNYILKTSHPHLPPPSTDQVKNFSQNTHFEDLEVIETTQHEPFATVTFKATLSQQGKDCSFTEKSTFEKREGQWLYLKGEMV